MKWAEEKFSKNKILLKNFFAENFFSSLNMYLCEKIFFQSEHVSSQIWCQKFFP